MKIALIGPGYGHNIKPYLDFFEKKTNHKLDFYYHSKDELKLNYEHVNFIHLLSNFYFLIFNIKNYDLIWVMGGGRLMYVISVFQMFKKRKAVSILNIWSEDLPRLIIEKSLKGRIASYFVSKFNIINCNWFGTAALLTNQFPLKVQVNPLGLTDSYYNKLNNRKEDLDLILKSIDSNSYNFFYPKSFTYSSRHDLVIMAVNYLRKNIKISDFKVYFLEGNVVDINRKKEILALIEEHKLQDNIIIFKVNRLFDTQEFNLFWEKMNCGLQIAEWDQLSNTIFEPLIHKKDIIISNITPYQYIKDYFGFNLKLTDLDVVKIAFEMEHKINNVNIISDVDRENIRLAIIEKYSFSKNFEILLENFEKNI